MVFYLPCGQFVSCLDRVPNFFTLSRCSGIKLVHQFGQYTKTIDIFGPLNYMILMWFIITIKCISIKLMIQLQLNNLRCFINIMPIFPWSTTEVIHTSLLPSVATLTFWCTVYWVLLWALLHCRNSCNPRYGLRGRTLEMIGWWCLYS